jgi:hypothetical protein
VDFSVSVECGSLGGHTAIEKPFFAPSETGKPLAKPTVDLVVETRHGAKGVGLQFGAVFHKLKGVALIVANSDASSQLKSEDCLLVRVSVRKIRKESLAWDQVTPVLCRLCAGRQARVGKLYTLGVASSTRGVTNHIDVFGFGDAKSWKVSFTSNRPSLTDTFESVQTNTAIGCSLAVFSINLLDSYDHQVFDELGYAVLLHLQESLGVVQSAGDSRHLSLVKNEVHLIIAHCIVEAHSCRVDVHACKESHRPLSSVLCPDTVEAPRSSLKLPFGTEAKTTHAASQVCHDNVDFGISLPDILSKEGTTLVVFSGF